MKGTGGLLGTARRRVGAVRQIRRVREIAGILLKYGLGELAPMLLRSPRFRFMGRLLSRKNREIVRKLARWERIRRALEELGPTFINPGQILSSRRDLLPRELIRELEKLQDEVPPFDFEQVLEIVRRETGRPTEEILPGLDPVPEASASIAQVHRARLEGGQEVAVKVRRPGIEEQIEVDVQILERVADLAERTLSATRLFNPRRVVQEFKRQIGRGAGPLAGALEHREVPLPDAGARGSVRAANLRRNQLRGGAGHGVRRRAAPRGASGRSGGGGRPGEHHHQPRGSGPGADLRPWASSTPTPTPGTSGFWRTAGSATWTSA